MRDVIAVVTVVVVGMMVGVEFAVAAFVNPILDRIPNDGALAARGDGARLLGRVMPFWYIGSLILGALQAALARGHWGTPLAATATALLLVSVVMSIVLLVPINSRVATWTQEGLPTDWKQQLRRWDRFHLVRVAVITLAFALFTASLT